MALLDKLRAVQQFANIDSLLPKDPVDDYYHLDEYLRFRKFIHLMALAEEVLWRRACSLPYDQKSEDVFMEEVNVFFDPGVKAYCQEILANNRIWAEAYHYTRDMHDPMQNHRFLAGLAQGMAQHAEIWEQKGSELSLYILDKITGMHYTIDLSRSCSHEGTIILDKITIDRPIQINEQHYERMRIAKISSARKLFGPANQLIICAVDDLDSIVVRLAGGDSSLIEEAKSKLSDIERLFYQDSADDLIKVGRLAVLKSDIWYLHAASPDAITSSMTVKLAALEDYDQGAKLADEINIGKKYASFAKQLQRKRVRNGPRKKNEKAPILAAQNQAALLTALGRAGFSVPKVANPYCDFHHMEGLIFPFCEPKQYFHHIGDMLSCAVRMQKLFEDWSPTVSSSGGLAAYLQYRLGETHEGETLSYTQDQIRLIRENAGFLIRSVEIRGRKFRVNTTDRTPLNFGLRVKGEYFISEEFIIADPYLKRSYAMEDLVKCTAWAPVDLNGIRDHVNSIRIAQKEFFSQFAAAFPKRNLKQRHFADFQLADLAYRTLYCMARYNDFRQEKMPMRVNMAHHAYYALTEMLSHPKFPQDSRASWEALFDVVSDQCVRIEYQQYLMQHRGA